MSEVTDAELLRLARKAWPKREPQSFEMWPDGSPLMTSGRYGTAVSICTPHPRAREALHAALRVLAGEMLEGAAKAFAAGREAERRDVVACLEHARTNESYRPGRYTASEALGYAAADIQAGEHVGAADKERGE